jgi:hypothetical protein
MAGCFVLAFARRELAQGNRDSVVDYTAFVKMVLQRRRSQRAANPGGRRVYFQNIKENQR